MFETFSLFFKVNFYDHTEGDDTPEETFQGTNKTWAGEGLLEQSQMVRGCGMEEGRTMSGESETRYVHVSE